MAETVLVELAHEVNELCASAEMARRKRLWETLLRGERTERPVVKCAPFMNGALDPVWDKLIPEADIRLKDGLARNIEIQLRKQIVKFRHMRDDDVMMPIVLVMSQPSVPLDLMWGLPIKRQRPQESGGAYKPIPPIREEADLDRLTLPHFRPDTAADAAALERARELVDGRIETRLYGRHVSYSIYEVAVLLRGAEELLYDVYDRPGFVDRLMEKITDGIIQYETEREAAGAFDALEGIRLHEPWDAPPPGPMNRLSSSWAYLSAQSSAPLGPAMFAEFVQPYLDRFAGLFWKVYYHGCEDLGKKAATLKDLPNLMHFHVSPWTDVKEALTHLRGRRLALEVHAHPTNVLFVWGKKDIREEARRRMSEAAEMPFDYVLCDLQTLEGAEGKLELWCDVAMEEAHRQKR